MTTRRRDLPHGMDLLTQQALNKGSPCKPSALRSSSVNVHGAPLHPAHEDM